MKSIWTYAVYGGDPFELLVPDGTEVLGVFKDGGTSYFLLLSDQNRPCVTRRFRQVYTGAAVQGEIGRYIGTLRGDYSAEHFFEL